jgi:CheY-like chemotaxis protein
MSCYKILVVEDNPLNQKILSFYLGRQGHELNLVASGEKALEVMAHEGADVVIMDLMLPGISGYETARRIRLLEQELGRRSFIIALTANAMDNDREQCLQAGMDEYMSKPFDIRKLNDIFGALNMK